MTKEIRECDFCGKFWRRGVKGLSLKACSIEFSSDCTCFPDEDLDFCDFACLIKYLERDKL